MQTLFLGNTDGTACSLFYYSNLVRLGHTVIPFDPRFFQAASWLEKIEVRLRKGPSTDKRRQVSEYLIKTCQQNQFDYVFVMSENFFGHETMEAIRKTSKNPPIFLYHSHDNNFSDGICKPLDFAKTIASYDFVFTTKSQNVEKYKKLGQPNAYFIASAYEPGVHKPINIKKTRYASAGLDVTFIGTYDHSRDPIMNAVGWQRLNVWGDHWKRFTNFNEYKDRIVPNAVYYFEFADIISHSKISLGVLREEAGDLHTQRTFEIPACGTLQIAPRTDEILSFFKEDSEIVCYQTLDELKDKVGFYLGRKSLRERIAKKGHQKCISEKHTYFDRLGQMFKIASGSHSTASRQSLRRTGKM